MGEYAIFPVLNAILNATSAVLIVSAVVAVRRGNRELHKRLMLAAVVTSALFLTSYLYYHSQVGSVKFLGQGAVRYLYFAILLTHTVLATVMVPFILVTIARGLRGAIEAHRKVARFTYPVWMYVSVTGVVIYVMLYQLFPHS